MVFIDFANIDKTIKLDTILIVYTYTIFDLTAPLTWVYATALPILDSKLVCYDAAGSRL